MPTAPTSPEKHAALRVEYDGTPFFGWTRQPDGLPTLEGDLIAAFGRLGCSDVRMHCAGRTDAGVHATAQVVDARYYGSIEPPALARALNGGLRPELVVVESVVAPYGFDARADATSRAYEYRLLTRRVPSPSRTRFVLHHPRPLDREALDAVAVAVRGQHTFTAFTPSRTLHTYFERTIAECRWIDRDDELVLQIRGNAFLRHMVRVLVGTMLAVGSGECSITEFHAMLAGAPRSEAFQTAPPHGLCLVDVTWEPVHGLPVPPRWRATRTDDALPFSTPG